MPLYKPSFWNQSCWIMGNMMVINANYDVKTAITREMKNSLIRVSNDLVCEIWVWRAYEGCFEMPIVKL